MRNLRSAQFLLLSILATLPLLAQQHPDFSGVWLQNNELCRPKPQGKLVYTARVDQQDSILRLNLTVDKGNGPERLVLPFEIGAKQLAYMGLDGDDFHTGVRWEGASLVFDTVELERGHKVVAKETWTLLDGGKTLQRVQEEEEGGEHSTHIFVSQKQESPVKIVLKSDRVTIDINGKPFTNLYMGQEAHKPFLYPLCTASGKKVTRGYPVEPQPGDPTDHPHQKGLWVGSERLSGMDFWENDPSYHRPHMGVVQFKDILNTHEEGTQSSFTLLADWVSETGETVVTETRKMIFYSEEKDCRMFDVDLKLRARKDIRFEDHQDSVIGMRLGPEFAEKNGGMSKNAEGFTGEAGARGQRSTWVDWQGQVEGETVGVAMMDHPGNYHFPTRWHIRSMGLMVASPFAQKTYDPAAEDAGKSMQAGEELHLRYRVLIHPIAVNVADEYRRFAAEKID